MSARSNDDWVRDLATEGPDQAAALADLRAQLLRALPGALRRYGPVPEHLLEDVVQDSLLRTLSHLDRFEGRSRFTTWATTIAVRTALTELRRRRWKDVSLQDLGPAEWPEPAVAAESGDPERDTAQARLLRALGRIVEDDLTDRQRVAILSELRGMPQEEIGRRLGISRNAVYKLGHDARRKLKRGLEASGFDASEIRTAFG